MKKQCSTIKNPRLFKSPFLEVFSKTHWSIPLFICIPIIGFFLLKNIPNTSIFKIFGLFSFGILIWTMTEYCIHRFIFHLEPKSKWGQRLLFIIHGVHHDYPNDSFRLLMPPVITIPCFLFFYYLFLIFFGLVNSEIIFSGFVTGYLYYDMLHYAIHHSKKPGKILKFLKKNHFHHHFQNDQLAFGVTSIFWDIIFNTSNKTQNKRQNVKGDL